MGKKVFTVKRTTERPRRKSPKVQDYYPDKPYKPWYEEYEDDAGLALFLTIINKL